MNSNGTKRGQETRPLRKRLYSSPAVFFGGNIGGPLAGGFMAAFNAHGIGKTRFAVILFSLSILGWLALIGLFFGLPNPDRLTLDLGLAVFAIGWFGSGVFFSRFNQKALKEYFSAGGRKKFFVEAVAIGMLAILLTSLLISPAISLFDRRSSLTLDNDYVQHTIYYSGLSEEEARNFVQVLEQFGHFSSNTPTMVDVYQGKSKLRVYFPESEVATWEEEDPRLSYYRDLRKHIEMTGYDARVFIAHYIDPNFHRRFATQEIK